MSVAAREAFVARRFDRLESRFRAILEEDDVRLRAVSESLRVVPGMRLLDVGCGKGRFARCFSDRGAQVWGLDTSAAMLASAFGFPRARASARRLPFANQSFDGAFAVEVFEHLDDPSIDVAIAEMARVVRPGGRVVLVDKNRAALDARRPWLPAVLIKRIDERRGLWMYGPRDPVRERWFGAASLARRLARHLHRVSWEFLLTPAEARHAIFRSRPSTRLLIAWSGTVE